MPFWYALCLILMGIEAVLRRGTPPFTPILIATILWAVTILCTILFLVPINNLIAKLRDTHPIEDWLPQHERWNRMHIVRIAVILLALLLILHALLLA